MNKARSHDSRQSWQWPRAIVALVLGQIAALAVMAAYAHGTAELVWPLELAPYGALAVVPVAGLAAVVGTALCLRMLRLPSRSLFSLVLALSALIGYTLATPVRLYPPAELHAQLPFYVDTTPSFGRAFAAIKDAPFPVLGAVSRPEALWIYLAGEAVVLVLAVLALRSASAGAPYCHSCRRWCKRSRKVAECAAVAPGKAVERAQARDWSFFRALGVPDASARARLRFDTASCPGCQRMHLLSLVHVRRWMRDRVLLRDARLTDDDLRTVKNLGRA